MNVTGELIAVIAILSGLIMILVGANALTDGAASIARRLQVSNLVIGLTIVAFGTSAPELAVSITSALKGSSDMAVGNVIGSNIFNSLLIIGCTAVIIPLKIAKSTLYKEIPLCILASFLLFICANDIFIDNAKTNILSVSDGLILISFFLIFFGYTIAIAKNPTGQDEDNQAKYMSILKAVIFIFGGLVGLIYGGHLFVDGATTIARSLGVSESMIGLTLIAGGTSIPELATSIVAAVKKRPEMAVGNVVGSNLFNILLILGCSSTIQPLEIKGISMIDQGVLIGSVILLFFFSQFYRKRLITRIEGAIMIGCFITYMVYLFIKG